MTDTDIAAIAEKVSMLLQIDRTHDQIKGKLDMEVLANVPAHLAAMFEAANSISGELTPTQAYDLINRRVSQVQAQVYLMRLELEGRSPNDPANIYADPLVVSAYGDRIAALTAAPKTFNFGPEILADGWYPMEVSEGIYYRWMRPAAQSLACIPHLGTSAQTMTIKGYVMHAEQLETLEIAAGDCKAQIEVTGEGGITHFTATLDLDADNVATANYLPVTFSMTDFQHPSEADKRLLGANISTFICTPLDAK